MFNYVKVHDTLIKYVVSIAVVIIFVTNDDNNNNNSSINSDNNKCGSPVV